jgi:hypothetical protein
VGNWASRFYRFIRQDVEAAQAMLEPALATATEDAETQVRGWWVVGWVGWGVLVGRWVGG